MSDLDDKPPPDPLLDERYIEALAFTVKLHARQARKGTRIPYLAHLLEVSGLVLEDGGTEDEAIAALLHDAVEDQGGQKTLSGIREKFGDEVARVVEACSDTDRQPKPPWLERKREYLTHLEDADPSTLRVSCADKLHNVRSIVADQAHHGDDVWERFSASPPETVWYYESLSEIFSRRLPDSMLTKQLQKAVSELAAAASTAPR